MLYKGDPTEYPVNLEILKELVDYVIEDLKVDGVVPAGTTGECATLSYKEHMKVIEKTVEYVDGRVPVIAGTGSNCTREAIELGKGAKDVGADYHLSVVPYYNKPRPKGLFEHFSIIAERVDLSMILYNVPSRTVVNLDPETTVKLFSEHSNIIGIKEANTDNNHIDKLFELTRDFKDRSILSGSDEKTFYMMKKGGNGVISVAANVVREMKQLTDLCLNKKFDEAERVDQKLQKLYKLLFKEPNPIPVKAALNIIGKKVGPPRLPLTEAEESTKQELKEVLSELGYLEKI
jgi:4-hydroxy-tetrahydrodipicolinate synthase